MPIYTPSTKAVDAPELEAALYDMLFQGVNEKKVKGGQYTKDTVNGDDKLEWDFKLLDDDGDVIREDRDEHPNFGQPVILSKLTGIGFNIASKTVPQEIRILKALLTADEFESFESGDVEAIKAICGEDFTNLKGRKVQGEVFVKDNGWPGIGNVIAARKPKKAKNKTTDQVDEE